MRNIHMTTAVLLAIKELENNGFSIYELTKNIRENVNDGEYTLFEYFTDVQHDVVREHFIELNNEGLLSHLDMSVRHGYRQYIVKTANTISTPLVTSVATPATVVQNAMNSTVIPTDVQLKIYKYLKNNGNVTTKMIQSRLKGHPYTCKDIYEFLNNIQLIDPITVGLPVSQRVTVAI